MIRIVRLLRLPSNYSHKFGEAGFPSTETVFARKISRAKNGPKTRKEIRHKFKKLMLQKRHEMKNEWYTYNYNKITNEISFVAP